MRKRISVASSEPAAPLPRRDFIRGLGFGAAGFGLAAGTGLGQQLADFGSPVALPGDEGDDTFPAACSLALMSTSRRAFTQQVSVTKCDPCNCPPRGQVNFVIQQQMRTSFEVAGFCDELAMIGFPTTARMDWDIRKKEVRVNGPCQTPIGSFAGKFTVSDAAGNPLIAGKLSGTLGYDPCTTANPCCAFPRVMGMLTGRSVVGTQFRDCYVRWIFCGVEESVQTNPCQIFLWDTLIHGIVRCPC